MDSNHLYNLMAQYTEESRALWRIRKHYIEESAGRDDELAFWKTMQAQKEQDLITLKSLIAKYVK